MDSKTKVHLRTNRRMPIVGLGTWGLKDKTAEVIAHALKIGYTMIDTSGDYGTQPGIAEGIKMSGVPRKDFFIVTKIEETDDAYEATKHNLSELRLEYADLVLVHRPPKQGYGEQLWQDLIRAKHDGLTKDIGVSNYSESQIQSLVEATNEIPVVNQIEWSPFGWSQTMLEFCQANDIVIQAYSPLTHGKRLGDLTVQQIAAKYEKTQAQVLIRWCLQMGTVPLPKANQILHLEENLDVFHFELDDEDMILLAELNENYSALGEQPVYQSTGEVSS